MSTKEILADVLVIGGGVAAPLAAIKAREAGAKRVVEVCKATIGSSGSALYMGGNIRDYRRAHAEEILPEKVLASKGILDREWELESLKIAEERMNELKKWGVKFVRIGKEEVRRVGYGGENDLNYWVDDGPTQFLWTLRSQAARSGVELIDRVMITDLLTSDGKYPTKGRVVGAVGFDVRTGEFYVFKAKATILATGRWSIARRDTPDQSADGQAMGVRLGATFRCMDLMEFACSSFLANATAQNVAYLYQGFGGKLRNIQHPGLSSKEILAIPAIVRAKEARRLERKDIPTAESYGSPAWDEGWRGNFKGCNPKDLLAMVKNQPRFMRILDKLGIDVLEDEWALARFPFESGNTGASGGLKINRKHETSIPSLFAAGDVADRVGYKGMGLTGALVGGSIAGANAAKHEGVNAEDGVVPQQVEQLKEAIFSFTNIKNGTRPFRLRHKLSDAICSIICENGFMTNEERLKNAITEIERLEEQELPKVSSKDPHELMKANEMRNMLQFSPIGLAAVMQRKESRFLAREDYPEKDDKNWLKFINFKPDGKKLEFWEEDVPGK